MFEFVNGLNLILGWKTTFLMQWNGCSVLMEQEKQVPFDSKKLSTLQEAITKIK